MGKINIIYSIEIQTHRNSIPIYQIAIHKKCSQLSLITNFFYPLLYFYLLFYYYREVNFLKITIKYDMFNYM